ncbi:Ig-like domain-containing protein, partial [Peribacillus simplex]|uniref:Ig-like domain-containing protein n=1 Tax=Peribacillus simplex TaxID=1478 RepID=UPI001F4F5D48
IPVQNASTSITVTAKDAAGKVSAARKISVTKVAPNMPTVNPVKYYTTTLTGKTEKYAKVTVKIGTKIYSAKANAYGTYKVNIPKQKVGTKIFINATDSKGRVSVTKSITVS